MNRSDNFKFREENLKKLFKIGTGYELNLENPKTFNEKLQWLKLYYHNPLMTKCADKYLAREYIKDKI
ncbi:glycosyl transferase, partial [Brachyspira catarrhinii]